MIVFRYLSRQVFQVVGAVTLILVVVAMISRFLGYLGQAVAGELSSDILLLLIFYRLPEFLLVIIPFALFLGIMLAYGRMYADNEMTVLGACGFSQRRLVSVSLLNSLVLALVMGLLSLMLAPLGLQKTEQLKESQDELTELDLIVAGQFQDFADGLRTTYAESITGDSAGRQLNNSFVAWRRPDAGEGESSLRIIVSETARSIIDEATGRRFMLLENGHLYDGIPGQADYLVTRFDEQALLMPEQAPLETVVFEKSLPTSELLNSDEPGRQAELQWRLSTILLIPVLTLIAIPMSRVDPRQGRFSKLLPGTLLYALYYVGLRTSMDLVAEEVIPAAMGLWWVHLFFAGFGLYLLSGSYGNSRRRKA